MIRISDLRLPVGEGEEGLKQAIRKELSISDQHPVSFVIRHRSLDARRSHAFTFLYTVDVTVAKEEKVFARGMQRHKKWQRLENVPSYRPPAPSRAPSLRPVVVGLGPAGIFAGLLLSRAGLCPVLIERGRRVEERKEDTLRFFKDRILDPESNVQFGEGGAGTFSDGKVNTLVKDTSHRGRFVLEEMVQAGAPETILYDAKPHIGTVRLQQVVRVLREEMIRNGAEVLFETRMTDLVLSEDQTRLTGIIVEDRNGKRLIETDTVFLGIGHSARDTFRMLLAHRIPLEAKPFAVGLRIEHPRQMIDRSQYREYAGHPSLGAASYKLTHHSSSGRGVYTFCMCPGGVVVAAASEKETIVTNGMSNYARDEENSNSALLVTVTPEDYRPFEQEDEPQLAGIRFQQHLEKTAYRLGGSDYSAPIQRVDDFLSHKDHISPLGDVHPSYTGPIRQSDLHELLPEYLTGPLEEGIKAFGEKLSGFDRPDAILTGVESRSSSPVRILRGENYQSALVRGLYPIGEGAGYAGGIMSAAMDGMKACEAYLSSL